MQNDFPHRDGPVSRPAPETPPRQEPELRRWPHPVRQAQTDEPFRYYLRCALSYQNQMLADIKTLLEKIELHAGSGQSDEGRTES